MSKKPGIRKTDDLSLLRREAEKLATPGNGKVENSNSDQDLAWLLHELQVQKIELEMQNEQLRSSNDELEIQRSELAGLYDLAPVGFFTLDLYGIIREINNTGSIMIGIPKKRLTGRNFRDFVSAEDLETFIDFLESVQIREMRQSCELAVLKQGGKFYARVEGIAPAYHTTENIRCYIAV
ncbi:MAG: sensor hybrid histidine kinase, partial [Mucilaginibacter sp.]|nr:sensor hybrid histidine kinase [Mucilaginibacter sp.]